MTYAIASDLIGFRSSALRVRIVGKYDDRDDTVCVRTADLLDAGTLLNLPASQLTPIDNGVAGIRHSTGFVVMGG